MERQRESDRLGLIAVIEGAELRRRLELAVRVIEASRRLPRTRAELDADPHAAMSWIVAVHGQVAMYDTLTQPDGDA